MSFSRDSSGEWSELSAKLMRVSNASYARGMSGLHCVNHSSGFPRTSPAPASICPPRKLKEMTLFLYIMSRQWPTNFQLSGFGCMSTTSEEMTMVRRNRKKKKLSITFTTTCHSSLRLSSDKARSMNLETFSIPATLTSFSSTLTVFFTSSCDFMFVTMILSSSGTMRFSFT